MNTLEKITLTAAIVGASIAGGMQFDYHTHKDAPQDAYIQIITPIKDLGNTTTGVTIFGCCLALFGLGMFATSANKNPTYKEKKTAPRGFYAAQDKYRSAMNIRRIQASNNANNKSHNDHLDNYLHDELKRYKHLS